MTLMEQILLQLGISLRTLLTILAVIAIWIPIMYLLSIRDARRQIRRRYHLQMQLAEQVGRGYDNPLLRKEIDAITKQLGEK